MPVKNGSPLVEAVDAVVAGAILRSGGAPGADTAFEEGAKDVGGQMEIYLPWPGFQKKRSRLASPTYQAFAIAKQHHPAWDNLSDAGKKLMARNCHQILGLNLDAPVDYVLCWTKDGGPTGGTGHAIRLAESLCIPVINLFGCDTTRATPEEICSDITKILELAGAFSVLHQVTKDDAQQGQPVQRPDQPPPQVQHHQLDLLVSGPPQTAYAETIDQAMMGELCADIWEQPLGTWICVTTNGVTKQDGTAVMGAGIAKEAAERFPDLPAWLGANLRKYGNRVFVHHQHKIITFPTKHNWKDKSNLSLIEKSCHELMAVINKFHIPKVAMPKPGCSNGGLAWATVQKVVAAILDPRIVSIYSLPPAHRGKKILKSGIPQLLTSAPCAQG